MNPTSGVATEKRAFRFKPQTESRTQYKGRTVSNRQRSFPNQDEKTKSMITELKLEKIHAILGSSKVDSNQKLLTFNNKRYFMIAFQKYKSKSGLQIGKMNFQKDKNPIKFIYLDDSKK